MRHECETRDLGKHTATITIRPAVAADAAAIARVHVDTWRTTYRGIVPDEHLAKLSYEKGELAFPRWLDQMPIVCVAQELSAGIVGSSVIPFRVGWPIAGRFCTTCVP